MPVMTKLFTCVTAGLFGGLALTALAPALAAPYLIIGLDQKMTWDTSGQPVLSAPGHDGVAIVDLSTPEAPSIIATLPLENSIQGPPTNLAVSPDNRLAIVANSITNIPAAGGGYEQVPADQLFVIDLRSRQPKLVQTLSVGKQPSGLSINPTGTLALVAYRGETAVGVFRINRDRLTELGRVDVGQSPSHVAFTPDGKRAVVVKQGADKAAMLDIDGENVTFRTDVPTTNGPYNVEITPNGRLAVVNDRGVLTVVELEKPERVIDRVSVGKGSEGLAVSPRGDLVISVALRGSNGPQDSPQFHERGAIVILHVDGTRLTPIKTIEVGRIPEGVGFAPDGRHFYVANFKDNDVWIFRVDGQEVTDTGKRLKLPGRPASARTTPATSNGVVR